nr:MAG: extensin [Pseudomonadota bacterium]
MTFERREAWRSQAESACLAQKLVRPSAFIEPMKPISGPGACGMDYPFRVKAFAGGQVALASKAVLACPAISTFDRWLMEVVQPAAELYFGATVTELRAGSYSCRSMNNRPGARRSEHSYGNAVDVMAFHLSDGRKITVAKGWKGDPVEQEFLREVFVGSCRYFSTVLGPGSDAYHYDHFHLDLARHAKGRKICKPVIKFSPRLEPGRYDAVPRQAAPRAEPAYTPLPTGPVYKGYDRPGGSDYDRPGGSPMIIHGQPLGEEEDSGASMIDEEYLGMTSSGTPPGWHVGPAPAGVQATAMRQTAPGWGQEPPATYDSQPAYPVHPPAYATPPARPQADNTLGVLRPPGRVGG